MSDHPEPRVSPLADNQWLSGSQYIVVFSSRSHDRLLGTKPLFECSDVYLQHHAKLAFQRLFQGSIDGIVQPIPNGKQQGSRKQRPNPKLLLEK